MSKRTIVLTGPMASGKTYLAKYLETKGYKRIVTYTTRPQREGEINGVDYFFIDKKDFREAELEGFFAESTYYDTIFGRWFYGSAKEDYNTQEDSVIVLNPEGVMALAKGTKAFVVWLDLPEKLLLKRAHERADDINEVLRRLEDDKRHFNDLFEADAYDLRIGKEYKVEELAKIVIKSEERMLLRYK